MRAIDLFMYRHGIWAKLALITVKLPFCYRISSFFAGQAGFFGDREFEFWFSGLSPEDQEHFVEVQLGDVDYFLDDESWACQQHANDHYAATLDDYNNPY